MYGVKQHTVMMFLEDFVSLKKLKEALNKIDPKAEKIACMVCKTLFKSAKKMTFFLKV